MKAFKFHRIGVQVKKMETLQVMTSSNGTESVSFEVPKETAVALRDLIEKGHHIFTAAIWTCPDIHKGC